MSIRRGHIRKIDDHFTITPNEWVRDKRLTRRARGLLVELLSHREGWEITTEALVRNGVEGRDAIKTAIRELEGCGYLVRVQTKNSGNRYGGIEYVLLDPDEAADFQSTDFQSTEKPSAGNPPQRRTSLLEDHLSEDEERPRGKSVRGTTLYAEWMPDPKVIDAMKTECPYVDFAFEHKKFVDHFIGHGKAMKDWDATWRNWIRRASVYSAATPRHPGSTAGNTERAVNGWLTLLDSSDGNHNDGPRGLDA
ncbi:hypothetical protein [Rhodococcus jostii]|uniref:hypothetical protein n=1 Tax=Rhodococcus jostii TaxID=132919 RepID=UPI0036292636